MIACSVDADADYRYNKNIIGERGVNYVYRSITGMY